MIKQSLFCAVCFTLLFGPTCSELTAQESIVSIVNQFKTIRFAQEGHVFDQRFIAHDAKGLSASDVTIIAEIESLSGKRVPFRWKSLMETSDDLIATRLPFFAERPLLVIEKDKRILTKLNSKWWDLGINVETATFGKKEYYATLTESNHCLLVELDPNLSLVILRAFRNDGEKEWEQSISFESSAGGSTGPAAECEISIVSSTHAINFFGVRGNELNFFQMNSKDGDLVKFWSNFLGSKIKR
ncbi:MAG: hypothetical protein MUC83_08040 [Pirellula sp.]|jgi:hypothetical protein|nr:hypothetical protein [Pirellula sp.]